MKEVNKLLIFLFYLDCDRFVLRLLSDGFVFYQKINTFHKIVDKSYILLTYFLFEFEITSEDFYKKNKILTLKESKNM